MMQLQRIATRCADSESGDVFAALAAGTLCSVLTGDRISPGFLDTWPVFVPQGSFRLEFPCLVDLKLRLILHWQPRSTLQGFGGGRTCSTDFSLWGSKGASRSFGIEK